MTYCLGVDLGTSYTAAAVFREGRAEIVDLGVRRPQMPSVVFVAPGGEVLVGDAAERRAVGDPERVVREFKRRLGDQVGSLVGSQLWSAEALMSRVLAHVVEVVTAREGEPPAAVALTHPANWGPYKLDLLAEVARLAKLDAVSFVAEPVAAAVHHDRRERSGSGQCYVVYDLGGGTFDATVVQADGQLGADGARVDRILGEPGGLERLGGIDFDEALRGLVAELMGVPLADFDPSDPRVLHGLAQLRSELVSAKEALSTETHVEVPLFLPGTPPVVRVTRGEFEQAIRPRLYDTMAATEQVLESAQLTEEQLAGLTVLLVGGSSSIPLVAVMVAEVLGLKIALDEHPKHAVALGAARLAAQAHPELFPASAGAERPTADRTEAARPPAGDVSAPAPGRDTGPEGPHTAAARMGLRELRPDPEREIDQAPGLWLRGRWGEQERRVAVAVVPMDPSECGPINERWSGAIAALARHPNLLATYEVTAVGPGQWDGVEHGRVLIGEPARGATLHAELAMRGAVSVADTVAVGVQLAGAVASLHRQALVHGALDLGTVVVTSWARTAQVKLAAVGLSPPSTGFEADARALGRLLHRMLCGVEPLSPLDRSMLERRGAPLLLIEALDSLLTAEPGDLRVVESAGWTLQQIELAERRVPTEFKVLGPEPTVGHRPLQPLREPGHSRADSTTAIHTADRRDITPAGVSPSGDDGPARPADGDRGEARGRYQPDSDSGSSASPGAPGDDGPHRLRVVTPAGVKSGWGATGERPGASSAARAASGPAATEPTWVTAARANRENPLPARGRARPGGTAAMVGRSLIPVLIGALIAVALTLVVLGR